MASLQTVVELIFSATDNASRAVENIGNSMEELSGNIQDVTAPMADLANQLLALETAGIAAGLAIAGLAIDAAGKFDLAFREIATLTDQSVEGLGDFRQAILDYAAGSSQSLDQVTAAVYNAISSGVDYTKSLGAVAAAEKLAVAGKADLNITLEALLGTLNAYGKGMESASQFSDVFFTTVKLGKTTIPELAASISGVTSTATLGGVSFAELGAAIATVTGAGAGTSEAVTRINAALTAIINPSSQARDLAESLGLQFDAQTLKSKGLAGVLADVAAKTGGSAEQMAILFGSTEALNAVNVLAVTNAEKFSSNLEAMGKAAGATSAAFEKMPTDTLAQAFEVLLVSLGTPLLDNFSSVEDALASLAQAFTKVVDSGGLDPLLDLVNAALGAMEETIETAAGNLKEAFKGVDLIELVEALKALGDAAKSALEALFGPIDITTVDGLRDAIQRVVDVATALTQTVTAEVEAFKPFLETINTLIESFKNGDPAAKDFFGTLLGYSAGINQLSGYLEPLNTAFLGLIAFGSKLAPLTAEAGLLAAGLSGPQGIAVALGVAATAIITFLVPAEKLQDYAWPDWLAGYEGATWGSAMRDVADGFDALGTRIENWLGIVDQADVRQQNLNKTLKEPVPVTQYDGAISAIARYEAEIKQNEQSYNHWFDIVTGTVPVDQYDGMISRLDELAGVQQTVADKADAGKKAFIAWGNIKLPELALPDGVQKAEGVFQAAGKAATGYATSVEGVSTVYSSLGDKVVKATGAFAAQNKEVNDVVSAQEQFNKVLGGTGNSVAVVTSAFNNYLGVLGNTGKLTTDQIIQLTTAANEFKIKMEEIASNERIKTIELAVDLNVAQLEADTARIEAALDSTATMFANTGDTMSSLLDAWRGAETRFDQWKIEEWIDDEAKRRDQLLESKLEMDQAIIEQLKARTDAMNRGDPLIEIKADGLQPQLEAFMWEILKQIQVRASADMQEFLLGISG